MASKKEEESKKSESASKAYTGRLSVLRKAQGFSKQNNIPKAVEHYSHYLNVLAGYFKISEEKLNPSLFNPERDITEMLLISHAYWDLAKAYDRSPRLTAESVRCLDQFVKFTQGYKYQYVNAQIVKKFLKSKQAHHPKHFQNIYKKLYTKGKACYIASHCYGIDHDSTEFLRSFREGISLMPFGLCFIENYYRFSPLLINYCKAHKLRGSLMTFFFFKPILAIIIRILTTVDKVNVYFKKINR